MEGIVSHARAIIQHDDQPGREGHKEPRAPDLFTVSASLCDGYPGDSRHKCTAERVWNLANSSACGRVSKHLEIEGEIVGDGEERQSVNPA